ncbi:hypothetical protein [Magnetospirillum molischianum]|uniref:PilZ domain-containing protein n=1 Tax=Magnetospirillum molischianum DSM 120 TaxID=1150626 RepID=H8FU17_MAGML|nr:hypothetical protein [Magnetospirillum molischianum]CCG41855.1 conserved hypothetical protein [Magnetospirillum molischianum DSM 120]
MDESEERRSHIRKVGQGLVVVIDRRIFPIVNISTAGLGFQATGYKVGDLVPIKIAKMLDLSTCVDATITVKSAEETITRGEFLPTMPLLRYIIDHIGEVTGVEPAYFRK